MSYKIELQDVQRKQLTLLSNRRVKEIETEIEEYESKIKPLEIEKSELLSLLKQFETAGKFNTDFNIEELETPSKSDYLTGWSIFKKSVYVMKESGMPLSTSEIVNRIILHEPKLENERRNLVTQVSSQMGNYTKKGKVIKHIDELDKFKYSAKE